MKMHSCSGSFLAIEAASGEMLDCFLCDAPTRSGEMFTVMNGRRSICPQCNERISKMVNADLLELFKEVTKPTERDMWAELDAHEAAEKVRAQQRKDAYFDRLARD